MTDAIEVEALRTEKVRLVTIIGKGAESIWNMRKPELVEVARKELGMSVATANQKTVTVLRELIRAKRKDDQAAQDPMAQVPKGLEKMKKDDLIKEMEKRNLPLNHNPTRPQMIVMIKDNVNSHQLVARELEVESPRVNPNTRSHSSTGQAPMEEDDNFQIVESTTPSRRRPRGQ